MSTSRILLGASAAIAARAIPSAPAIAGNLGIGTAVGGAAVGGSTLVAPYILPVMGLFALGWFIFSSPAPVSRPTHRREDRKGSSIVLKRSVVGGAEKPAAESPVDSYHDEYMTYAASLEKTPDILKACKVSMKGGKTPEVKICLDGINPAFLESLKEIMPLERIEEYLKKICAEGFRDGLLQIEALSQKDRDEAVRFKQEEMLLKIVTPKGVATIHNPGAEPSVIRKKSVRISNLHNRRKKRTKKVPKKKSPKR